MRVTPILAFDIETIPDVEACAACGSWAPMRPTMRWWNSHSSGGARRPETTSCRRTCSAWWRSRALREANAIKVWSLGSAKDGEADLVKRFFDGIEKYTPQLVSWNGSGFDLPVLHYRALVHGIPGCCYWDMGENDREFKFNNYISRFHSRHTDLMDVLAGYQNRAWAPLDEIAQLCGLPGKLGMDGSQVWPAWQRGEIDAIRNYCETDVANTYLLFQRFQRMRGALTPRPTSEVALFRQWLGEQKAAHWKEFAAAWR